MGIGSSKVGDQTVYIWESDPLRGRVGHASMKLKSGLYISWWPPEEKQARMGYYQKIFNVFIYKRGSHTTTRSLLWDMILQENRSPDHTLKIEYPLDERSMKSYWSQEVTRYWNYGLISSNCCTVIYAVLEAGGAPKVTASGVWTPGNLRSYIEKNLKTR